MERLPFNACRFVYAVNEALERNVLVLGGCGTESLTHHQLFINHVFMPEVAGFMKHHPRATSQQATLVAATSVAPLQICAGYMLFSPEAEDAKFWELYESWSSSMRVVSDEKSCSMLVGKLNSEQGDFVSEAWSLDFYLVLGDVGIKEAQYANSAFCLVEGVWRRSDHDSEIFQV